MPAEIPPHCDYSCPHAQFPPADTAGICRTMSAVLCGKLAELVNKNAPCEWRRRGGDAAAPGAARAAKPLASKKRAPTPPRRRDQRP